MTRCGHTSDRRRATTWTVAAASFFASSSLGARFRAVHYLKAVA